MSSENHKILLVDDHPLIHKLYSNVFKDNGFELLSAYDGLESLNMINEYRPDLIILDILMPKMDGRDVCLQLKNNPDTKNIKIIFLTSKNSQLDRRLGFELGADEYIEKPCSGSWLLRVTRQVLGTV